MSDVRFEAIVSAATTIRLGTIYIVAIARRPAWIWRTCAISIIVLLTSMTDFSAQAASASQDLNLEQYLAIWSLNSNVIPPTIKKLYTPEVVYYGRTMPAAAVLRDKLAFIRQWPRRHYDVVPGTVMNDCSGVVAHCRVIGVLQWRRADASGRRVEQGMNTIRLDLVREAGTLKIARESGRAIR